MLSQCSRSSCYLKIECLDVHVVLRWKFYAQFSRERWNHYMSFFLSPLLSPSLLSLVCANKKFIYTFPTTNSIHMSIFFFFTSHSACSLVVHFYLLVMVLFRLLGLSNQLLNCVIWIIYYHFVEPNSSVFLSFYLTVSSIFYKFYFGTRMQTATEPAVCMHKKS